MKYCNFYVGNDVHVGICEDGGVYDLTAAGFNGCLDCIIGGADVTAYIAKAKESQPVTDYKTACPVNPGKVICVGLNYNAHAVNTGFTKGECPTLFSKFNDAVVGSGADIYLPEYETTYDYEAELVIVIGKGGMNIPVENAEDYIFGYSCGNDLSVRVPQKKTTQWLIGKTLPGFGPVGPCIVTKDSFNPENANGIKSYVNGEMKQNGRTDDMIFTCKEVVSFASKYIALKPGDIIFTGTPAGVQLELAPEESKWLKKGDVVTVEIDGIGILENKMV